MCLTLVKLSFSPPQIFINLIVAALASRVCLQHDRGVGGGRIGGGSRCQRNDAIRITDNILLCVGLNILDLKSH